MIAMPLLPYPIFFGMGAVAASIKMHHNCK